ncbi:MAG: hypothetical protein Tsb0020_46900 [Haliangiales bacterium]
MSRREEVLGAIATRLSALTGPTVLRNAALPQTIPAGGLVILGDGDPGEPEVMLSPLAYLYTHAAEIDVIVRNHAPAARDAAFDALLTAVAGAVHADRTLGGLADWIEVMPAQPVELPIEGAEAVKAATLRVIVTYESADSLA